MVEIIKMFGIGFIVTLGGLFAVGFVNAVSTVWKHKGGER